MMFSSYLSTAVTTFNSQQSPNIGSPKMGKLSQGTWTRGPGSQSLRLVPRCIVMARDDV